MQLKLGTITCRDTSATDSPDKWPLDEVAAAGPGTGPGTLRQARVKVVFDAPFAGVPTVMLALQGFSGAPQPPLVTALNQPVTVNAVYVQLALSLVTTTGFEFLVIGSTGSRIFSAVVGWMAFLPETETIGSGTDSIVNP